MFYVAVLLGILVSVAMGFLLPLWAFAIYLLALVTLLAALPTLLASVLDPHNAAIIRNYCAELGISQVTIRPFPNHYGIRFRIMGRSFYTRCRVSRGEIQWKGKSPEEMIRATPAD
jgi:hypothetical protein